MKHHLPTAMYAVAQFTRLTGNIPVLSKLNKHRKNRINISTWPGLAVSTAITLRQLRRTHCSKIQCVTSEQTYPIMLCDHRRQKELGEVKD